MENKIKILIVPDKTFPFNHALLEHIFGRQLPARGYKVSWFMAADEARGLKEKRQWGETDVFLYPSLNMTKSYMRNRVAKRAVQIKYFTITNPRGKWQIMRIAREQEIDLIFVRNDVEAGLIAHWVARKLDIPFVYYLGFPTQEALLELPKRKWAQSRYMLPFYGRCTLPLRNWLTKKADFVFTMSEFWREKVIKELQITPERVAALPYGFDTSCERNGVDTEAIRSQFKLNGRPVVLYIGALIPMRDTSVLVETMFHLVKAVPNAVLLILPGHDQHPYVPALHRTFVERGLAHAVIFAPSVPHADVYKYIATADVGISPIERSPVYDVSSPAKFVEMLGMGLPVVASDTPEQERILEETRAGICTDYDAQHFAEAIQYLLTHPAEARAMGERGRAFVAEHRSFSLLADTVEDVFKRLVDRNKMHV